MKSIPILALALLVGGCDILLPEKGGKDQPCLGGGVCKGELKCVDGICREDCVVRCGGKCGGPDTCGGQCPNTCTPGNTCLPPGYTQCVPEGDGGLDGNDGSGGDDGATGDGGGDCGGEGCEDGGDGNGDATGDGPGCDGGCQDGGEDPPIVPCAGAIGRFTAETAYGTGEDPNSVAVADFNADGILDLAVANFQSNSVSILLGNGSGGRGNGTFDTKRDFAVAARPYTVAVGDFNRDGILDLATANIDTNANNVSVLLGTGSGGRWDGGFAAHVDYPAWDGAAFVAPGDFDADGILDLAVADWRAGAMSILLGNGSGGCGDGTFKAKADYTTAGGSHSTVAGDFNADHVLDLAVANIDSGNVSVLLGNGSGGRGNGTFGNATNYAACTYASGLAGGDFNADGVLDLAVACENGNMVAILLGNGFNGRGNGTFVLGTPVEGVLKPYLVTRVDFDGDGILDLVTSNVEEHVLTLLRGNGSDGRGDGTFSLAGTVSTQGHSFGLAAGDFNADRIPDLVATNLYSDTVSVLLGRGSGGRGDGTFAAPRAYDTSSVPAAAILADFNRDGILDLASANRTSENVGVRLGGGSGGRGDGTFGAAATFDTGGLSYALVAGDFNHDGILDLAVAKAEDNAVAVLLGNGSGGRGDGTFASPPSYGTAGFAKHLVSADFNADGILDLAVANQTAASISILLGTGSNGVGSGAFGTKTDFSTDPAPMWLAAGDFNADGILDLVAASRDANVASVLLGNGSNGRGNGTFGVKTGYAASTTSYWVGTADFNGDGILDLAVANWGARSISILLGNGSDGRGDGTFADKTDYTTGPTSGPTTATIGDFNGDGILDLAASVPDAGEVRLLFGNGSNGHGNGTFLPPVIVTANQESAFVTSGHLNPDGILDLVVVNPNQNKVHVLLGQGSCLTSP